MSMGAVHNFRKFCVIWKICMLSVRVVVQVKVQVKVEVMDWG